MNLFLSKLFIYCLYLLVGFPFYFSPVDSGLMFWIIYSVKWMLLLVMYFNVKCTPTKFMNGSLAFGLGISAFTFIMWLFANIIGSLGLAMIAGGLIWLIIPISMGLLFISDFANYLSFRKKQIKDDTQENES